VAAVENPVQEGVLKRTRCYEGKRVVSIVTVDGFEQGVS